MKGMPGLIAVVLDDQTTAFLRKRAVHDNVFARYVTMAYRPTSDVYAKYAPMIGKRIEFDIVYETFDAKGQAVVVSGVPSENAVPHITISCTEGTKPSYSNTLFDKTDPHTYKGPVESRGGGVVEFVRI